MAFTPGHQVGPFQITRLLGSGGMGTVYLAYDTRLERRVALKVLRDLPGEDTARRVLREARAAGRLTHANIAALYDVVEQDGLTLLVMEYVEGESLSATVKRGPLRLSDALDLSIEIAAALAHAHDQGIVHADVKPGNVMLTRDGHAKLLDLGIARIGAVEPMADTRTSQHTTAGSGTPSYMSPEQLSGRVDARSDIYSAGLLIFELLTGRRAYDVGDVLSLALAISTRPAPRVSDLQPGVPTDLDEIVARAMARDPSARFQAASELRDALIVVKDAVRTGGSPPTRAAAGTRTAARFGFSRRGLTLGGDAHPALRVAVPVTLGILAITAFVLLARPGRPPASAPAPGAVAVLPAINLAGDPATAELGAGLVSVLTSTLSRAPGATVASHAAVVGFAGAGRDLAAIARELGAGYVVDVSIGRRGDRLRVDGRVLQAAGSQVIWTETLDGDAVEIYRGVLDGVARALERVGAFRRALTGEEQARLRALPTADAEALLLYARGAGQLEAAVDPLAIAPAISSFEAAVARDGQFALAHAGLADAYASMYAATNASVWVARAASAAQRALAIDPAQSPVHVSLARVYLTEGQLENAERHARLAVDLARDSDDAHRLLGRVLAERGQVEAGLEAIRHAIALRPDYWINHDTLGYVLYRAARYAEAVAPYRRVTELRPDFAGGYQSLGTMLHYVGQIDDANGYYEHALRLGEDARAYSNLAFGYYSVRRFADALRHYEQAVRLDPASPVVHQNIGDTYLRLGDVERARRAFAEAVVRAQAMLQVNPNDARTIAVMAVAEAKLGQGRQAGRHAREAASLTKDDSEVLYKLAVVQALAGEREASLASLGRAIGLGYPRAFAMGDWDLLAIADRPEFKALTSLSATPKRPEEK